MLVVATVPVIIGVLVIVLVISGVIAKLFSTSDINTGPAVGVGVTVGVGDAVGVGVTGTRLAATAHRPFIHTSAIF